MNAAARTSDAPASASASAPGSSPGLLLALAPALLALAWLVERLGAIWSERPEMQFGWIVLLLSAYLVWEKWPERPAARLRPSWLSTFALGIAWLLLMGVQAVQAALGGSSTTTLLHTAATFLVEAACLHVAFGWPGVRLFAFPCAFLLVALPIPSVLQGPLVASLQGLIASLNVELLNLLGIPAQRVGSLIHLSTGTVGVDEACSGIRSLQSSLMATLFIGYLTLRSNTLRVLLFVGGTLTAILGNVIRSFYLSYTASSRGIGAVGAVHDTAGWSILAFTAAGVALLAWSLARAEHRATQSGSNEPPAEPSRPTLHDDN